MELFQILLVILGLTAIVGGIAIFRLWKLSPQDMKTQSIRAIVEGVKQKLIK